MNSNKENYLIIIVIVLILFVVIFYYFTLLNKKNFQSGLKLNLDAENRGDNKTKQELKIKIKTPELDDKNLPVDVAKPKDVIILNGPANSVAIRFFEIKGENGKYIPNKIIVNDNDIVTIKFYAIDSDYDIFFPDFGSYLEAKKGEEKQIQFQAVGVGEYNFVCKNCKESAAMVGTFIVNQK